MPEHRGDLSAFVEVAEEYAFILKRLRDGGG